jgi:hypothetical protein
MQWRIKCADISNVLKPLPIMRRWGLLVTNEFFTQGDAETFYGMDVTPCMDRRTQGRVALQKGFVDFVCTPFFAPIVTLFPAMARCERQMVSNRARWAALPDDYFELIAAGEILPCGMVEARAFSNLTIEGHLKDEDDCFRTSSFASLSVTHHLSTTIDARDGAQGNGLPVGLMHMIGRNMRCMKTSFVRTDALSEPWVVDAHPRDEKGGPGQTPCESEMTRVSSAGAHWVSRRSVRVSSTEQLPWPVLRIAVSCV